MFNHYGMKAAENIAACIKEEENTIMSVEQSCENCRFIEPGTGIMKEAFCRRYPPTVLPNAEGCNAYEFPIVLLDDWCGEWQKKI